MKLQRTALALCLVVGTTVRAEAHDYWLEPSSFKCTVGELLTVRHFVGHPGDCVEKPRNEAHYDRWALELGGSDVALLGRDGQAPAGFARPSSPGLGIIVYASQPTFLELPAVKFESYLREEGLEHIVKARAESGLSEAPGRELYSRCAKTLVRIAGDPPADEPAAGERPGGYGRAAAGHGRAAGYGRVVGLPLELIPVEDPFQLAGRTPWTVELRHAGQPVVGATVELMPLVGDHRAVRVLTDERGRVRLTPPEGSAGWSGAWLVHAVHMLPAPADSKADWRSYWASLTFETDPLAIDPAQ